MSRAGEAVSTADPNPGLPMTLIGIPKFARFKALNASARIIKFRLSVNRKFFTSAKSKVK
jgi:hypothetical protein